MKKLKEQYKVKIAIANKAKDAEKVATLEAELKAETKKKEEQRRQWESSMRAEADYQRMIENDQRRANPATPSYARKSTAWFD